MSKAKDVRNEVTRCDHYRFVKVNGAMRKVHVRSADSAFKAAMKVRKSRKQEVEKELLVHGVTS
ncbi:hypothetical protein DI392_19200 [Vibrio albus]|uniref:Uncharacterized protein n=1 Tax=Vibrio albus TaxID=2200953 RepID=A0A2U3B4N5_9VIBR|nr:hypothetical protein [Vibrio albus]PWI31737.1 hypothetical protein DI392_19200 [Vibrio albus]